MIYKALMIASLGFLSACAPTPAPKEPLTAPAGNWVSLFNGKDLSDWTAKVAGEPLGENYRNTFRVEDGLLKISYQQYDKFDGKFGGLYFKKKFAHYWLRAEYRFVGSLTSGAPSWAYKNSGVYLHAQPPESIGKDQIFPVSVEFDLVGGHRFGNHPTGDVCQNGTHVLIGGAPLSGYCSKLSDVNIPGEEWTSILAEVDGGKRVRQAVNGGIIVAYTDITLDDANVDAQRLIAGGADKNVTSGYIGVQSNGHPVEFRRIDILPLEDAAAGGAAPDAPATH